MCRFIILFLLPFFSFSQVDDLSYLFFKNDNGLVFSTDLFKDYYYAGEIISESVNKIVEEGLVGHQNYINSEDSLSVNKVSSYLELLFLSKISDFNTLPFSEKIYQEIVDKRS